MGGKEECQGMKEERRERVERGEGKKEVSRRNQDAEEVVMAMLEEVEVIVV